MGLFAVLLCLGRFCSLTQLRVVELAIFGFVAAYLAAQDYHLVYQEVIRDNGGLVLSQSVQALLHYAVLVAAYGIFIPNTWQRAAVLIGPNNPDSAGCRVPVACAPSRISGGGF